MRCAWFGSTKDIFAIILKRNSRNVVYQKQFHTGVLFFLIPLKLVKYLLTLAYVPYRSIPREFKGPWFSPKVLALISVPLKVLSSKNSKNFSPNFGVILPSGLAISYAKPRH